MEENEIIFENFELRERENLSVAQLEKNLTRAQLRFFIGQNASIDEAQKEIDSEERARALDERRNQVMPPRYRDKIARSERKRESGAYRYQKINRARRARYVVRMRLLAKYLERCGITVRHFMRRYAREFYLYLKKGIRRIWGRDVASATRARIAKHYKDTYFFNISKSYSQSYSQKRYFLFYSYAHEFTTTRARECDLSNLLKRDKEKNGCAVKKHPKKGNHRRSWQFVRREKNFAERERMKIFLAVRYALEKKRREQNYWLKFKFCSGVFRSAIKKAWEQGITKEKFLLALSQTMESYAPNLTILQKNLFQNLKIQK